MRSFILLVLLCSCGTTAKHGFTAWGQEKYTLNTAQSCVNGEDAVRLADKVLPEILTALKNAGHIKMSWPEVVDRNRRWPGRPIVGVCLVEEPEPCCIGKACIPPVKDLDGQPVYARKSGCASDAHAWASLSWPPICRPEWKDEPHCVASASEVSHAGWEQRLFHEIFNMSVQRWANYQRSGTGNYYNDKIYAVELVVKSQLGL